MNISYAVGETVHLWNYDQESQRLKSNLSLKGYSFILIEIATFQWAYGFIYLTRNETLAEDNKNNANVFLRTEFGNKKKKYSKVFNTELYADFI